LLNLFKKVKHFSRRQSIYLTMALKPGRSGENFIIRFPPLLVFCVDGFGGWLHQQQQYFIYIIVTAFFVLPLIRDQAATLAG
jgi:hypothetical protein